MISSCVFVGLALFIILSSGLWLPLLLLTSPLWVLAILLMFSVLKIFGLWGRFMRIIYEAYEWLMYKSDKPKRYFWQKFYNLLCWKYPGESWKTMNLGYASETETGKTIDLLEKYEDERFSYQLYDFVCSSIKSLEDFSKKSLVEIGSGRGGGLLYVKERFKPTSAIGIDYSIQNVQFCKRSCMAEGVEFYCADAERLPLKSESVDIVLCIETAHCFGSLKACLNEVKRVLKQNGHFLIADFYGNTEKEEYEENFNDFLKLVERKDISENVLLSMKFDTERRKGLIETKVPYVLQMGLKRFAGIEGSNIYNQMEAGDTIYVTYHFIKE